MNAGSQQAVMDSVSAAIQEWLPLG